MTYPSTPYSADKCDSMFFDLYPATGVNVTSPTKYNLTSGSQHNIVVGAYRYILQPLWSNKEQKCVMHTNSPAAAASGISISSSSSSSRTTSSSSSTIMTTTTTIAKPLATSYSNVLVYSLAGASSSSSSSTTKCMNCKFAHTRPTNGDLDLQFTHLCQPIILTQQCYWWSNYHEWWIMS